MKWIAALLAALVLSLPLAFAEAQATAQGEAQAQAKAEAKLSMLGLRLRQIGQAFGDFVFHVKKVLTFDEKAKVELIKERNAEMKARQRAWLETKAEALAKFDNMTAQEKQEIIATIQAEHEAIIKEHLRLTEEISELQLKAKAKGNAQLELKAKAEAEEIEKSELSFGLKAGDLKEKLGVKVKVKGNVSLSAEAKETLDKLVSSLASTSEVELKLKAEKGETEVKAEVNGQLTAEQESLWTTLQNQTKQLVEASSSADAEIEIEIEHELEAKTVVNITAEQAKEIVRKKLGFDAAEVRTEVKDGVTFFVVTGEETETAGSFELEKSFEVWIEAGTGLITSVDLSAHIEAKTEAGANSSASASASTSAKPAKTAVKVQIG